jgi:hypothetical protein
MLLAGELLGDHIVFPVECIMRYLALNQTQGSAQYVHKWSISCGRWIILVCNLKIAAGTYMNFCETESNHVNDTDSDSEIVFLHHQF